MTRRRSLLAVAPGGSIHTSRWLRAFVERGWDVALVAYGRPDETPGVRHVATVDAGFGRLPLGPLRLAAAAAGVRRVAARLRPDVVQGHYLSGPGWLAAGAGRPLVLTAWGDDVLVEADSPLRRLLHRRALARAAAATCGSEWLRGEVRRLAPHGLRVEVVVWGVDDPQFAPGPAERLRDELGIARGAKIVVSSRGLIERCNPWLVLEAFARTAGDAVLVVKTGPADDGVPGELREEAARLGIADRVRWLERLERERFAELYRLADVWVTVPSWDGAPASLFEAMTTGTAIVASDIPPNREWVRDGETGLVTPLDAVALAERLTRLLDDDELRRRVADNARRLALERADFRKEMDRVERLYEDVIAGRTW